MLKRIRNDKQNAVTLNLFQGLVVRYFATLSMTGNILCHSEYCRLGLDPTKKFIKRKILRLKPQYDGKYSSSF